MTEYSIEKKRELITKLNEVGLELPYAFNFHDQKRLWNCKDDSRQLKAEYANIGNEIMGVVRANLSINHSNFKGLN